MIIVDTSALIAMMYGEDETVAAELRMRLSADSHRVMSSVSVAEFGKAVKRICTANEIRELLDDARIRIAMVDEQQAQLALDACLRFPTLSLASSFAYALARANDAPLLFAGSGFAFTDITPAMAPIS